MKPRWLGTVVLSMLCMNVIPYAYGADILTQFHPSLSLKEEYTDSIILTATDKKDDYITTIQPGIKFSNMDAASGIDLDYLLGFVSYGKNSNLNYISHNGSLNAKYLTQEHVNFYFKDSFVQSNMQRERQYFTTTADNDYVLTTETEPAAYWRHVAAPTVEYQFGAENRIGLNYRNNIYRTDSPTASNSEENYVSPFLSYWFDRQNGVSLNYGFTNGHFEKYPGMTAHRGDARYTHRFSEKFSTFAEYAYTRRTFDSIGSDYDIHDPGVGITLALSPTLTVSFQAGYFWMKPQTGDGKEGYSLKGELRNIDPRTTYQLGLQAGYSENYFTANNLGFYRYNRITGSATHYLEKRVSIGATGSLESVDYQIDRSDTIWGVSGTASYMPLKWLTFALEASHWENQSTLAAADYEVNRGMITITAAY